MPLVLSPSSLAHFPPFCRFLPQEVPTPLPYLLSGRHSSFQDEHFFPSFSSVTRVVISAPENKINSLVRASPPICLILTLMLSFRIPPRVKSLSYSANADAGFFDVFLSPFSPIILSEKRKKHFPFFFSGPFPP